MSRRRLEEDNRSVSPRFSAMAVAVALVLGLALVSGAKAGSIFDDNWSPPPSPPRTAVPPEDSSTSKPSPAPPDVSPNPAPPPIKPDVGIKPPADAPPAPEARSATGRRAVPSAADQTKSRKLFKELYVKELTNHSAAGRRDLAAKLLAQSATVSDSPVDEFVLLAAAADAGREGSDLQVLCKAADAMAEAYDVDGLRVKSENALKMSLRADSPAVSADNCRAGMKLFDDLMGTGDLVAAGRLIQLLRSAATDNALTSQVVARAKDVETQRAEAARIVSSLQTLKTSPEDPAANLAAGKYYCFIKGDWSVGIVHLAKSGDAALKSIAQRELARPADAAGKLEIADAWLAYAAKIPGSARIVIERRALKWYDEALPSLTGLEKVVVGKKRRRLLADITGLNGHPMTPDEIAARFKFPDKGFQAAGDSITGKTGNYDDFSTYVWSKDAQNMAGFEYGFEMKAVAFQTIVVEIDGQIYRFTRGFQAADTSRFEAMGKTNEFTKGGIKNGGDWASLKVVSDEAKLNFFYNGAAVGKVNLITPMTAASMVKVGFSSHFNQISIRNLYLAQR